MSQFMAFSGSHFRFRGCWRPTIFRRYRGSIITSGRYPWAAAMTPRLRLFTDAVTTAEDDISAMIVSDLRVRARHICPTRFARFIRPDAARLARRAAPMTQCRGHLGLALQNGEGSGGVELFFATFLWRRMKKKVMRSCQDARP